MTKAEVPQEELPRAEPSEKGLPETESKTELPKAECASGSIGSKEEPEEKIDFDKADLKSLWDQHNTDSEGESESLSSTECNDPESVQRGIRPDRHPFRKLVDLEGKEGPKYSRPVQHQPTTTRRPGLVDADTGIEHRLTEAGHWLPVLGAAHRTGKARSKASKYKQKAERKAKAIARKKFASTPPWREQARGSGSAGSRDWKA